MIQKNKLIHLFLLFSIYIFNSCNSDNKSSELITIDVKSALNNSGEMRLSEIADDIELIKFESNVDSYFSDIKKIHIGEKYIVVSDMFSGNLKLLIFLRNGEFHSAINHKGKGPGEYLNIESFAVNPDESQIIIGDPATRKLIEYDFNGNFIKEIVLDDIGFNARVNKLNFLNNDKLIVSMAIVPTEGKTLKSIVVFDKNLNLINSLFPKTNISPKDIMGGYNYLDVSDEYVSFWESAHDTIFYINKKMIAKPKYLLDASKVNTKIIWPYFINTNKYLFMMGLLKSNKGYNYKGILVFDKIINEGFILNKQFETQLYEQDFGILNDINGLSPFGPFFKAAGKNILVFPVKKNEISQSNIENITNAQVIHPEKRENLLNMLKNTSENDNTILMIVHLKDK